MKKYSILFTFICVLFLGIQSATAQDNSAELNAKNKTKELQKTLELTSSQIKKVYEVFLAFEKSSDQVTATELQVVRRKITAILQPAQQEEYRKSYIKQQTREEKIEGTANEGQ